MTQAMPHYPPQQPIRLAIIEDDAGYLDILLSNLAQETTLYVLHTAATVAEGLAMLQGPACDVLLVDLGLPDGSGLAVVRDVHKHWPQCHVIVSTVFGDEAHVIQSIEAGAIGYLLKDEPPQKMVSEIRTIMAGGSPISPMIARKILTRLQQPERAAPPAAPLAGTPPVPAAAPAEALSQREAEVLDFITRGYTADEIGRLMNVSRNTVLTFIRRIYRKLEVKSKAEAIFEARQLGILK